MILKMMPLIRAARADDIVAIFGKPFYDSFRGYVAELDGKIIGIGGIIYTQPAQAISEITDEMRKYPVTLMRGAKMLIKLIESCPYQVFARPSEKEKTAKRFLTHLGFVPMNDEVYIWLPQQYH